MSESGDRPPSGRPSDEPSGESSGEPSLREELEALRDRVRNLETALVTNRRIAMALGIVMARHGLTEEQAFAELRSASQRRHQKLREIADEVVYTGDLPKRAAGSGGSSPGRSLP
jgi:hypothetical protein